MNINELIGRYINELLVQWWESERCIFVWLGPGKHKNVLRYCKFNCTPGQPLVLHNTQWI